MFKTAAYETNALKLVFFATSPLANIVLDNVQLQTVTCRIQGSDAQHDV